MTQEVKIKSKSSSPSNEVKIISIIIHLSGILSGLLLPLIIPFAILIGSENKYLKIQAKKALNWQISLFIYLFIAGALWVISLVLSFILIGIPFLFVFSLLFVLLYIANIALSIIAAVKANEGIVWDYPFSIEFFK